jgi:DNA polymerase-3 subunit alpha
LIGEHSSSSIAAALDASTELREMCDTSASVAKCVELAQKIEGMPRTLSTHAAGIVISPDALVRHVPLQQGTGATPLTQYSMEHVEAVGLVKIDFLGLRTLSVMERAMTSIRTDYGVTIDFASISDDDPKTYAMLAKGDTLGVFQLESAGMRKVLRDLKPSQFEDLISVLALYRPGPMEFIPRFIQAKHGQISVEYPHPDLAPILQDTYGIIVYQEQIMQIANRMAGFRLGEADLLRRAVSKKKREILDEQRQHFVEGSLQQGYSENDANKVYDMIVRFADYGFPRAHATAYAVLAFQTAWLKAHYPASFMASMMTAVVHSQEKIAEYVEACRQMKIQVLPPDVNQSGILFTTTAQGVILFGLAAIKNVGFKAVESIINERADRPFVDLVDFCQRIDLSVCNKRVIESLILCGAMDGFSAHRAQLLAALDEIVDDALKWKKNKQAFELDLFGFTENQTTSFEYSDVPRFALRTQLAYEREGMGVYLSGHPLDSFREDMDHLSYVPIEELHEYPNKQKLTVIGMVLNVRTIVTKKGQPMAFVELENKVARCEVTVFPKLWERTRTKVTEGAVLVVSGELENDETRSKLLATQLLELSEALATKKNIPTQQSQTLLLKMTKELLTEQKLAQLEKILLKTRGKTPVVLFDEENRKFLQLDRRFCVHIQPQLLQDLESLIGQGRVKLK